MRAGSEVAKPCTGRKAPRSAEVRANETGAANGRARKQRAEIELRLQSDARQKR